MELAVEGVLFCPEWTATDEIKLLTSIDEYGYGNWVSVASQVGKDPEECKAHYVKYYVMEPHPSLPALPAPPAPQERSDQVLTSVGEDPEPPYYPGTEIKGYMPHRGDFAVEAHEQAEKDIAELNPEADIDELAKALYLTAVDIYCDKLRQRVYKKRFIRDYGLLDIRKQLVSDDTVLSQKRRRVKARMKPFLRFKNPEESEKLLQSLYLEDQISIEIRRLQEYRRNGVTTLKGGELYSKLATKRKQQREEQKDTVRRACSTEGDWFCRLMSGERSLCRRSSTAPKEKPPMDISHCLGVEKLTEDERELCTQHRIQPHAYLQYKMLLISEFKKEGRLRLSDARRLLKIDVNKTRKIYNFLISKELVSQ